MVDASSPAFVPRPRILIVEDEVNVREFCRLLLRREYDVAVAEHGLAALDLLRQQPFDLVLTDLQMPHLDGIALIQQLHAHHLETDAIVMTANATVETAREALKLGALDYIAKPIDAEQLQKTIRTALELRRIRHEKERLSDLVLMYQFSQAIAGSLDIEQQTTHLVEFVNRRFAPIYIGLSLIDAHGEALIALTGPQAGASQPLTGATEDALREAYRRLAGNIVASPTRRVEVVLRSHDHAIGMLELARAEEQPPFDAAERRLIEVFASHLAASLDNARLYRALKEQYEQMIAALVGAIEARDTYTYGHSQQVTRYAVRLAKEMGLSDQEVEQIHYAGLLHDIGKIGVRDDVLLKPGALSPEEFAQMRLHPQIGVRILEQIHGLRDILPIIEAHHERVDGNGYPRGLRGDEIPLGARILAVADAFEALTADRAYRPAMDPEQALQMIQRGSGYQWDPTVVDAFVRLMHRERLWEQAPRLRQLRRQPAAVES
ncbi:HD domain-containing phosphohydrolase [Chloroflexus sp.]|uniref:HD domain-containing phosphohydrolase n=1 Tax=Chloroflexus sp. TaxID=1904827 RepID=UPI00261E94F7|nr:HD domain-containing phosphohydrolase [uncultured Chloroflexus sp.]